MTTSLAFISFSLPLCFTTLEFLKNIRQICCQMLLSLSSFDAFLLFNWQHLHLAEMPQMQSCIRLQWSYQEVWMLVYSLTVDKFDHLIKIVPVFLHHIFAFSVVFPSFLMVHIFFLYYFVYVSRFPLDMLSQICWWQILLGFFWSGNVFTFPVFLKDNFGKYKIWRWHVFSLSTEKYCATLP